VSGPDIERVVNAMAKKMLDAVGEDLEVQALYEIMAWGTVLPETQEEIQRRMAAALA
jgi:hypothetical protein